jgi:transcriptional regulator with XRE-family HTH domain
MQALAKYLEAEKLSCTAFADRLGVKDSTVWRWRFGKGQQRRSPSLALALRIETLTGGRVPASSWGEASAPVSVSAPATRKAPARVVRRRARRTARRVSQPAR